jgi:hypothetical protein
MVSETYLIDGTPAPTASAALAVRPFSNNGYTPAKSDTEEGNRLAALDKLFDAGTIQLLTERGVTDRWQCLEVGGGRGSIATWLSEARHPARTLVQRWTSGGSHLANRNVFGWAKNLWFWPGLRLK